MRSLRLLLTCIIAEMPAIAHAQVNKPANELRLNPTVSRDTRVPDIDVRESGVPDPPGPYKFIEEMPGFNGDLNRFIKDNLRYPDSCRARGEEGRVIVQFIVDTTGLIMNTKVVRSSTFHELDLEAIRLMRLMEHQVYWKPGRREGKAVPVEFTMPVTFRLD